jgi:LPS export ABC transporter protein LptC
LQNQQAARYARWAAWAALAIVLVVGGVYGKRAIEAARAKRDLPKPLSKMVQQQSNEFSISKTENSITVYTVRASQATEYKDENRTELKDVWITIFGRNGDRNDDIHTRECSYEPKSGSMHCQGAVQINLAAKKPAGAAPDPKSIQITTSNLSFNRASGEATTPEAVQFAFAQGTGHAVGVAYSSDTSIVELQKDVEFDVNASDKTGGLPIKATGGDLFIFRDQRRIELNAPAVVQQGPRQLSAQKITIELDEQFTAQRAIAEGDPVIRTKDAKGESTASAARFEATLDPAGWIKRIVGTGNVTGADKTLTGSDRFSASSVDFAMEPQRNAVKTMNAAGGVTAVSNDASGSRTITTDAMLVKFVPATVAVSTPAAAAAANSKSALSSRQRIDSAESLAPATIETHSGDENTAIHAKQVTTKFNAAGKFDQLLGHDGVQITRKIGNGAPQTTTSTELAAAFGADGQWSTLNLSGNVKFQQSDRQATAKQAQMVRATDLVQLSGSPVLSDSSSRTTAGAVSINQKSGEIRATGGVVSTYLAGSQNAEMNLGSGPGHVSADSLAGSNTSGHAVYSGHARLWQGQSVLDASQIELWRDEKKMQATGNVVAVFPQASGPTMGTFGPPTTTSISAKSQVAKSHPAAASAGQTLWHLRAPSLTYWSDQGKAHLETGVSAESEQGSIDSRTLDVFLGQAPTTAPASGAPAPASSKSAVAALGGGRQMEKALAQGNVVVRQGDRRATAEQALYTAADGKFTLSGGQPTIVDAQNDTTTGRSLTFFIASDTILIDSQEGSRTVTKHRVDK